MYYICKTFDTWTFYDGDRSTSRVLEPAEIASVKALFPSLIENKNLFAMQIAPVNPNKLVNLPTSVSAASKKAA